MDDLSEKLDRLLGSADGMKKIEEMMAAFGGIAPPAPAPPVSEEHADGGDLTMLLKLLPLFGQMGQEDENTALLRALRPHLKNGRERRLDESVRMLQMMKLLPLLRELKGEGEQ